MRKNGFTLIELLAVIVVLAVIVLIAIPVVMDVISNAEKGAAERSAENYASAVERLIATERLDGNIIETGTYEINSDGNLVINGVVKVVEINGKKPTGGTITISNGEVLKETTIIIVGNYTMSCDNNGKFVAEEKKQIIVDNTFGVKCTLLSGKLYEVGSKYLCDRNGRSEQFYIINSIEAPEEDKEFYDYNLTIMSAENLNNGQEVDGSETYSVVFDLALAWFEDSADYYAILPTYEQLYAINNSETLPSWLSGNYWLDIKQSDEYYQEYIVENGVIKENNDYILTGVRAIINLSFYKEG
ncbi:MAG: prepilin-type N-terminal cleavage/methylation domain-containing protein [Firmicutes bacterium]|nr:prepilin-type N-terminal cleavage/methylation domain-containing protein [Bacillota bacterium]